MGDLGYGLGPIAITNSTRSGNGSTRWTPSNWTWTISPNAFCTAPMAVGLAWVAFKSRTTIHAPFSLNERGPSFSIVLNPAFLVALPQFRVPRLISIQRLVHLLLRH